MLQSTWRITVKSTRSLFSSRASHTCAALSGVSHVGVVGAGQIGSGWAATYLKSGLDVTVFDMDPASEQGLRERLSVARELMSPQSWGTLHFTSQREELANTGVVTECVNEVLELKQKVLAELDGMLDSKVPIFSSCSGTFLLDNMVEKALKAPERILVAHPFHPVHLCPLVTVVKGSKTDPELVPWALGFFRSLGKHAVESNDQTGYVANRLQEALWREALHMIDKGMATPEQIDAAVLYGFGRRYSVMGPMMTYHLSSGHGIKGFMDHFGVTQDAPYSFLDAPEYTPELKQKIIDGVEQMSNGRSVAELAQARDVGLVAVEETLAKTPPVASMHKPQAVCVRVRGVDFHVVMCGAGPPVICLPGAIGTAEADFGPQLRGLSEHHLIISFDPRGYGNSRSELRTFPVDFYRRDADDAAAIMDALGHSKYSVLGWSDGANSSVHLAAAYPERVGRLCFWGANADYNAEDIDAFEKTRDIQTGWSKRMREPLEAVYGLEELQRLWAAACDAWQEIFRAGGNVCGEEAKQVSCPTLIIHGAKDPMVLSEHPERLHQLIRGSELKILPDGKHNVHLRYHKEVNALILDHLGSA